MGESFYNGYVGYILSNLHIVHFKYLTILFVSYTSVKVGAEGRAFLEASPEDVAGAERRSPFPG